ncbi:MAG: hypothetical protein JXQ67_00875 [Campylobacterales bacterium]|nr:hypothetical protein [Campylobacterales bacterium]
MWQSKDILSMALVFISLILFNGCATKTEYVQVNNELYKDPLNIALVLNKNKSLKAYEIYQEFKKDTYFDGYSIRYLGAKPYFEIKNGYFSKYMIVGLRDSSSFTETYGLIPYNEYTFSYTFMMFTLNEKPYDKGLRQYFNIINQSYEKRLELASINKFVKYRCDNNIEVHKWERDEQFQPLEAICYAKRLEKDVFLITRFAYPNTQNDRDLFQQRNYS